MFADIIVDISHEQLDKTFQYKIPQELERELELGMQVNIPFGKGNRLITGYVVGMSKESKFPVERTKAIDSIVTKSLGAINNQIKLAAWLKNNYGCTMNQALKTVIPVKEKVREVQKKIVHLNVDIDEAKDMIETLSRKAKAQARLIENLIEEPIMDCEIIKSKLNISMQTMNALSDKGIIRIEIETGYRNPIADTEKLNSFKRDRVILNDEQRLAVDRVINDYDNEEYKAYLLYGVTGSGKTEVYLDIIQHVYDSGRQVIVLIPEIALTFQTVARFYHRFGDAVSILNSRMSKGERYDQYMRAMRGEISIMIGPRSALFTPFSKLGLIVIDEEHEGAYQSEITPKYHARPTAIHIAKEHKASVLLGSATPSMESFYRAKNGEYELLKLEKRAGKGELPLIHTVDLRQELKSGNRSIFSIKLQELMKDRLEKKQQIMLFLNKRGYAGFVSCKSCGHVMKCPHCDVSLTSHNNGRMVCHYCGFSMPEVKLCPECGSSYIYGFRAGTQAVEEHVRKMFPTARVLRMDMDTTKGKDGHEKILTAFANEEADILIGTQMIVKGHDFPKVTLVGIIAADMSLYASDYRASERTFQLLSQAAGRAGRAGSGGEVVIQSYTPDNYSIVTAADGEYEGFYEQEIAYRNIMRYPPVNNMLTITLASGNEEKLAFAMDLVKRELDRMCVESNGDSYESASGAINNNQSISADPIEIIGPTKARIYKINDIYYKVVYARSDNYDKLVRLISGLQTFTLDNKEFTNVTIQYDFNS